MMDSASQSPAPANEPPAPPARSGVPRWIWVLLMLLTAGLVGGIGSLLSHAAGNNIPGAILTGGGAFAGTVGLLLAIALYAGSE